MSRWKSPKIAAKRAERAAKEATQKRREKRNGVLLIIGWAIVTISLTVGDYFWLRAQARRRREEHLQRQHQRAQTNSPAAAVAIPGQQTAPATTNHE